MYEKCYKYIKGIYKKKVSLADAEQHIAIVAKKTRNKNRPFEKSLTIGRHAT